MLIGLRHNDQVTLGVAAGEFFDNSFDAGASEIRIDVEADSLTICDNGKGCSEPSAFTGFGDHRHQVGTKLGRYGLGGKFSAIALARHYQARTSTGSESF